MANSQGPPKCLESYEDKSLSVAIDMCIATLEIANYIVTIYSQCCMYLAMVKLCSYSYMYLYIMEPRKKGKGIMPT